MRIRDVLAYWWVAAFAVIALITFISAFPDQKDNTFHAGLIALCMANVLLVDALRGSKWLQALGAVGVIAGSYLWMASDAPADPWDRHFLGLLILLIAVGLIAGLMLLPFISSRLTGTWRGALMVVLIPLLLILATLYLAKWLLGV